MQIPNLFLHSFPFIYFFFYYSLLLIHVYSAHTSLSHPRENLLKTIIKVCRYLKRYANYSRWNRVIIYDTIIVLIKRY